MKRIVSVFMWLFYAAAGLTALLMASVVADALLPQVMASRIFGGKDFGAAGICENLLKGDLEAASRPIRFKTELRELRFADTVTWIGGKGESPYVAIPASPLFTDLPKDLGPVRFCSTPKSYNLAGDRMSATLGLVYDKHHVTVTLRYRVGIFSGGLERIEISVPEPRSQSAQLQKDDETRMREFMEKLDAAAGR